MIEKKFKFSNGDVVIEKITGFTGTITGTCFYITGCNQYLLTAKGKDDITQGKSLWYDEGRLKYLKEGTSPKEVKSKGRGCDIPAPIKN